MVFCYCFLSPFLSVSLHYQTITFAIRIISVNAMSRVAIRKTKRETTFKKTTRTFIKHHLKSHSQKEKKTHNTLQKVTNAGARVLTSYRFIVERTKHNNIIISNCLSFTTTKTSNGVADAIQLTSIICMHKQNLIPNRLTTDKRNNNIADNLHLN